MATSIKQNFAKKGSELNFPCCGFVWLLVTLQLNALEKYYL